jgi:hypothetical protein
VLLPNKSAAETRDPGRVFWQVTETEGEQPKQKKLKKAVNAILAGGEISLSGTEAALISLQFC